MLKDYYKILQCNPGATPDEIKKSYRLLALQYHPDTNQDNVEALANFNLIQEAYEVLSNPIKRSNYLNEKRWQQSNGAQHFFTKALTPYNIWLELIELEKYVVKADSFTLDKSKVYKQLSLLLSSENIALINKTKDIVFCNKITSTTYIIIDYLDAVQCENIITQLSKLQTGVVNNNHEFLIKKKRSELFAKYNLLIVILAGIILMYIVFAFL